MLHYKDLTKEQKEKICNGCGSKGGFLNPPEFLFHASCNHHDFLYWRGGSEEDRKRADEDFYRYMQLDAVNEDNPIIRSLYELNAWLYYEAVRLFGAKYFYYTDTKRDIEELKKLMEK